VIETVACAIGLAILLAGEARDSRTLRYVGKPLASASFLALAACAHPSGPFGMWLMIGLAFGAVGDLALLSKRGFIAGLAAFLIGHVAYVVAVARVVPIERWASPLALVPIAAAGVALVWLWPHLGKLRVAVIAYVIAIVAMVIAAIALGRPRFVAGAVLFFASDLAVARDKFVAPGLANRACGLPAYYAGQLLIAWSISL
jgi:uncharacterized membrane protein YhhN